MLCQCMRAAGFMGYEPQTVLRSSTLWTAVMCVCVCVCCMPEMQCNTVGGEVLGSRAKQPPEDSPLRPLYEHRVPPSLLPPAVAKTAQRRRDGRFLLRRSAANGQWTVVWEASHVRHRGESPTRVP